MNETRPAHVWRTALGGRTRHLVPVKNEYGDPETDKPALCGFVAGRRFRYMELAHAPKCAKCEAKAASE